MTRYGYAMADLITDDLDIPYNEKLDEGDIEDAQERLFAKLDEMGIDEANEVSEAHKNFGIWTEYFTENNTIGRSDKEFTVRSQYDNRDYAEFERLRKTALQINKIYDSVKKTAGEMRKNKPDLLVRSLNGAASQDEINVREDFLRTMSYNSQVDLVYQQVLMDALTMGFGAFKVGLEYESSRSFNKMVKYSLLRDPTLAYFDPVAELPHKGDGNFCGNAYILSKEEFYALYPYAKDDDSFQLLQYVNTFVYNPKTSIVLVDYTKKMWYPCLIYELSDGSVVTQKQWDDMQPYLKEQYELADSASVARETLKALIPKIVRKRISQDYKTYSFRMTRNSIVEATIFPSKYLPMVYCPGDSHYIDGREYTRSYVRDGIDAQRVMNYQFSEMFADIRNRRREQWLGTPDNIRGREDMWYNPELQQGVLIAEPDRKTNGMPQKMPPWEPSQGILAQYQQTTADLRQLTGFEAEMAGNPSNAVSGVAIARRQYAGSMSSYIFEDNWRQAIAQGGRIAMDLMPYAIGHGERQMPLKQRNGDTKNITFNKQMQNGKIENQIRPGDFDIEIDAGASFAVQKETAVELLSQLASTNPNVFPLVADLLAKNMDIQYMPQLVKRLETLVPPQILAAEKGEPPPPPQPNPQAQMMQVEMATKQSAIELNKAKTASEMARAQTMQATVQNHSAEVDLRKNEQQIKIAQMSQQGAEFAHRANMEQQAHALDAIKSGQDYEADMAKTMVDLHKHHNPQPKETSEGGS